jgi:peptidoglycan DL-endopeptidase CwlO
VRASCHQRPARLAVFSLAAIALLVTAVRAQASDPGGTGSRASDLRTANASLDSRSQQALLALYSLESRLGQAERRIEALETRSAQVRAERAAAQRTLELARSNYGAAQAQLGARLRQLYLEGDVDPLAVLLGAESLDEVLSALDGLNRLAVQDKDLVAQLARAKLALRTASARLSARQDELLRLVADARATRRSLASARDARAAYLAGLRRRQTLNRAQIGRLTEQAAAAESKSEELTAPASSGTTTPVPPPPPAAGTKMTVSSTGYCLTGDTTTGVPTSRGVVAVDPAVIPLGTRMYVPGYGPGFAADTGSAVRGRMIDVWFPSCAEAMAWGRKTVTITLR